MLLNSWSLALVLSSLLVVFLLAVAARTAVRVIRFWNPASDESRQISLESEIWLSSTLVTYALALQILSLALFILAADNFAEVITGAMCATGTLLVNDFGVPALLVKMVGVFFYGFWLVLHRLDIHSEHYPLVRHKCWYLLALLPLLAADLTLQSLYLFKIEPDIITSCCAVVFNPGTGGSQLWAELAGDLVFLPFYGGIVFLLAMGGLKLATDIAGKRRESPPSAEPRSGEKKPLVSGGGSVLLTIYGAAWLLFLPLALLAITVAISSYIYAMPFHNCPFCILKPEYGYIGFAIYGTLLPAAFCGLAAPLSGLFRSQPGLAAPVAAFQRRALAASLLLLLLFTLFSSYHYLRYLLGGGEW